MLKMSVQSGLVPPVIRPVVFLRPFLSLLRYRNREEEKHVSIFQVPEAPVLQSKAVLQTPLPQALVPNLWPLWRLCAALHKMREHQKGMRKCLHIMDIP